MIREKNIWATGDDMRNITITMTTSAHRYGVRYSYKRKKIVGFSEYHKLNNYMTAIVTMIMLMLV